MNLKNYTTEVPASKSIAAIESLLVNFGARNIMKEYGPSSNVVAIAFILEMDGMKLPFRLPANVQNVYLWLKKQKPKSSDKLLLAQAERICWKQQCEWVHLQLSLIEINQAEVLELFFPLLYDVKKNLTYYQQVKENKFKALISNE